MHEFRMWQDQHMAIKYQDADEITFNLVTRNKDDPANLNQRLTLRVATRHAYQVQVNIARLSTLHVPAERLEKCPLPHCLRMFVMYQNACQ